MTETDYRWFKMDTGDVETKTYNKHWFDVIPEVSTLTFDTNDLVLDKFILHLLLESDKVSGITAGTSQRTAAINRLEASIDARERYAEHKAEVSALSSKLKRAYEYAQSPLAEEGDYWEKLATEFLKL